MNKALLFGVILGFTLLILMPHIPAVEYQASETAVKEQFTEDLLSFATIEETNAKTPMRLASLMSWMRTSGINDRSDLKIATGDTPPQPQCILLSLLLLRFVFRLVTTIVSVIMRIVSKVIDVTTQILNKIINFIITLVKPIVKLVVIFLVFYFISAALIDMIFLIIFLLLTVLPGGSFLYRIV
jgi:hypothetical protein